MIQQQTERFRSAFTKLRARITANDTTCHVLGATLTALLCSCIFWVSQNPHWFCHDEIHSQAQIDDAAQLVAHASQFQRRLDQLQQQSERIQIDASEIRKWLPSAINIDQHRLLLRSTANQCGLAWTGLQSAGQHDGSRVHVIAATCRVSGTTQQIGLFLQELSSRDAPIWCDGISIARDNDQQEWQTTNRQSIRPQTAKPQTKCNAVISLRLPFAGPNTIAEKILQTDQSHAI